MNEIKFLRATFAGDFTIQDGDSIRIEKSSDIAETVVCRYIDPIHVKMNDKIHDLYDFAAQAAKNGWIIIPLRASLPAQCLTTIPNTGKIVSIEKGKMGYITGNSISFPTKEAAREYVEHMNRSNGITKAQEQAMLAGSLFGWAYPAADPVNYDADGNYAVRRCSE